MELFKNTATIVGCVSACIALLITIFKPIRVRVVTYFSKQSIEEKQKTAFKTMQDQLTKSLENDEEIKGKIDDTNARIDNLESRIDNLEQKVLINEQDRLKSELARYAAMCRRGEVIHESEFLFIQEVYEKYHIQLNGNHIGTDNYNTIKEYFEKQNHI